jgi:hypothetical protein
LATIVCGASVRRFESGVFEGTWVGEPGPAGILGSTTTFGSGVFVDGVALRLVPPSHMLEAIYVSRRGADLFAANSFAALLRLAQLELQPGLDYPEVFARSGDGVFQVEIPTRTVPVAMVLYEGMRIGADGAMSSVPKRREAPFTSYEQYRERLLAALRSAAANAPGFELVATISSGYDSASMATLAREVACHRAVTLSHGKPGRGIGGTSDSGEFVGRSLGMEVKEYDRLSYKARDDLPEAEFLATGMSAEDVVFSAMGNDLRGALVVSGFMGDGMWWLNLPHRPLFWRFEQAGTSLGEFRLRNGFIHVPLPWFGASQMESVHRVGRSEEMEPWFLGTKNDRPIPRRMLEEAGIPRGKFADTKRQTSAQIHSHGPEELAPATLAEVRGFAARAGETVSFKPHRFSRWRRALMRYARRFGAVGLANWLERPRRKAVRHDAAFGSLLLRWSVEVVGERYRELDGAVATADDAESGNDTLPVHESLL